MNKQTVGIAGIGIYLPEKTMSAKEIAAATGGIWAEEAVREKLGIQKIHIPEADDGTQEMGVKAALACIQDANMDPKEINVILCVGEEWKEYPLTTSALYIQDKIGAVNAWGIDVQNRCCTTISALSIAKNMLLAEESYQTILVCGGYRNGDFVDFSDKNMSMMFNLSAGAGAILLKKGMDRNLLLGSHMISDGSLSRTAGVEIGGIAEPITAENLPQAYHSLRLLDPIKMKNRLNEVSMPNWYQCIDQALLRSGKTRSDINYLNVLHMKRSGHKELLKELGLSEDQSVYLEDYGHIGQIDLILSLKLGLEQGKIKDGDTVCCIAAGIGYVWAACIIQWGQAHE